MKEQVMIMMMFERFILFFKETEANRKYKYGKSNKAMKATEVKAFKCFR